MSASDDQTEPATVSCRDLVNEAVVALPNSIPKPKVSFDNGVGDIVWWLTGDEGCLTSFCVRPDTVKRFGAVRDEDDVIELTGTIAERAGKLSRLMAHEVVSLQHIDSAVKDLDRWWVIPLSAPSVMGVVRDALTMMAEDPSGPGPVLLRAPPKAERTPGGVRVTFYDEDGSETLVSCVDEYGDDVTSGEVKLDSNHAERVERQVESWASELKGQGLSLFVN